MVVWSSLFKRNAIFGSNILNKKTLINKMQIMEGHHNTFRVRESDWQFKKVKDLVHYYLMVGLIPITGIILYTNIFIGPAKLAPIPEGYVPKHWEYYSHPISRFLSRYCYPNPQQDYEKYLHHLFAGDEKFKIRRWDKKILLLIRDRLDYQAWYFRPIDANYTRIEREMVQELQDKSAATH